MCGRFALSLSPEEIDHQLEEMELHVDSWLNQDDYQPRAAVVRRVEPKETRLVVDCQKWGLVPHWTESPVSHPRRYSGRVALAQPCSYYATALNTINARDDRVMEPRGLWNSIKRSKRCIVLCEGFFEWLTKGKEKIPHFTRRTDGKLMCLAGLWDSVTYKGATEELRTFTIITTSSNKYLSFLHDRMPVILPDRASMETWLDTCSLEWSPDLSNSLKPFQQADGLICYPVPKEVGKVGSQSADFLKPISERKGNIASFFQVQAPKKVARKRVDPSRDEDGRPNNAGEEITLPSSSSAPSPLPNPTLAHSSPGKNPHLHLPSLPEHPSRSSVTPLKRPPDAADGHASPTPKKKSKEKAT